VGGMLDGDILNIMMTRAGMKQVEIRRAMPVVMDHAQKIYIRTVPMLHRKVCPGVRGVLRKLDHRGAVIGLVTGNLTRIGWRKLERAGIAHYFRYGAFGEMAASRGRLVKWAIREARLRHSLPAQAPVALVGDATSDVIAARENGIRIVSVRTGITPVEDLEALQPDYLLRNLRDFRLRMVER
jgi:phosphoglycolate phosphatase